jgi:sugar phosphate isomerase/epimerase
MNNRKFAVSSADDAPATAPILLRGTIADNLKEAARLGYDGIEVHMREDAAVDFEKIDRVTQETGTRVAMVVTGRLGTEGGCSLVADEPYIIRAALDGMRQYIDVAEKLGAGIVVGWVKGSVPRGGSREKYLGRLAKNLGILAAYGADRGVALNLEVINRYETNIFNTAEETLSFLDEYALGNCFVHLDTFHMGIEEADACAAIRKCKGRIGYMHLADNTRRYPGSGCFDFRRILGALDEAGYDGYLSVECLPDPSGTEAAKRAVDFLKNL